MKSLPISQDGVARIVGIIVILVCIASSGLTLDFPGPNPGTAKCSMDNSSFTLHNSVISATWTFKGGQLKPVSLTDKMTGTKVDFDQARSETFRLLLGDGRTINASECKLIGTPRVVSLRADRKSPRVADRFTGKQVVIDLEVPNSGLKVQWTAALRNGSNYIRPAVAMSTNSSEIMIKRVVLISLAPKSELNARVVGTVAGSPLVMEPFYFAYEHANSDAVVGTSNMLECGLNRNSVVKPGKETVQTSVIGVVPEGQLRRGFLYYVERERAHPYRPFMHYNSWFDQRPVTEQGALEIIDAFGKELGEKRGVTIACTAWDDRWDDPKTLWQIDKTLFPQGWKPIVDEGKKYNIPTGLWMSPFGGYGKNIKLRAQYAKEIGIETDQYSRFSMTNSKYYKIFYDTSVKALENPGSVYFKYDGLNASKIEETEPTFDLIDKLRQIKPDLFVNLTTGPWSSPFYLWHGDSVWRNGEDTGFAGKGTPRNRWVNYRDTITFKNDVTAGPLYPLNSLMYHGFIIGQLAQPTRYGNDPVEMRNDMRDIFGNGTATMELYITPKLMSQGNWDDLAECAKWYLSNKDVLVDTHWVGGNPADNAVYGFASWSPRKGTLTLRNPDDAPRSITVDIGKVFELPKGAATTYTLSSPWKADAGKDKIIAKAGESCTFTLSPWEVLVFDAQPIK